MHEANGSISSDRNEISKTECVSTEELVDFRAENLPEEIMIEIRDHVMHCTKCCRALYDLCIEAKK